MKNLLKNSRQCLLYALPVVLFFSYYPRFALGETDFMHLELSLPLFWLVIFTLISIPNIINYFKDIKKHSKIYNVVFFTTLIFILYLSFSIFWSLNPFRAVLTSGIVWCIFLSVLSLNDFSFDKLNKQTILKIFLISTLCICLFCWLQCILDLVGLSRPYTLLCLGCASHTFGFPHPNGFAIEPQFMGNLLIAPTLTSIYLLIKEKSQTKKFKLSFMVLFFSATLFLTFSRGAIYSFCIGLVLLLTLLIAKTKSVRPLKSLLIVIISFAITLCSQGIFAATSKTNDTFITGVTKSIHQLSLGIIDFRPANNPTSDDPSDSQSQSSTFDGYVEESTNTRLDLTDSAINISTKDPSTFFFGVGLGGAGKALGSKEIIQNEYASILLELGLIGFILFIVLIILIIILFIKKHPTALPLLLSVILSYLLTIFFFSGLPNALHIYILPFLLYYLL